MGFNSGFKGLYDPPTCAYDVKMIIFPSGFQVVVICVVRLLFVLFYVLFVCKGVLPPSDNPTAVNKYISYHRFTG